MPRVAKEHGYEVNLNAAFINCNQKKALNYLCQSAMKSRDQHRESYAERGFTMEIKGHCPAKIATFSLPYFHAMSYRQISPNIQLHWIKRFQRAKQEQ